MQRLMTTKEKRVAMLVEKSTLEENQLSATTHGDKSGSTIAAKIASTKANIGEKTN